MRSLYWEVHEGNGPYLLLVHGFLSSRAQWRLNLDAFREYATPVVAELWGHGRSPRASSGEHCRPHYYLAQFERIRAELGAERWLLCGQSLGASLTLRYALTYPERVIAQAFTNSNSAFADEALLRQRYDDAKTAIADIETRGIAGVEALRVHPRHAKRLPEGVHEELLTDARGIEPLAITDSYRHLNLESSVRDTVSQTQVPTMLAFGRFEKRFVPYRDFALDTIPGLHHVTLDAGHPVNIQAAEPFNIHVGDFFRRHIASS
jgi:pimeloyl-ACP methyl ester carboxylesterase